ncbi:response regulator [Sandaracinus amylolyticus]|uniref:response regulator n=1 Tax=Sandaracinus amylolyticus TaxID=927083 RepID=UPI001F3D743F|nr:response regulator [Sandaracinus amylolyticus]UJR85235.1 Hypothetical protein I5071_73150 [Sandaracinus amylolyticus]
MSQCKVCIVDDDDDIREAMRLALELHGLEVIEASDGEEALARLHGSHCGLVLLDLMMPGMNGWEFRAKQKADPELASIPVLVLSGARDVESHARELGASAWVQKPIELDHLIVEVDRLCNSR